MIVGLQVLRREPNLDSYMPAIILMPDGIARLARGRVVGGRHDPAGTFRKVKGYN